MKKNHAGLKQVIFREAKELGLTSGESEKVYRELVGIYGPGFTELDIGTMEEILRDHT